MNEPVLVPTPKPQPDLDQYGLQELELFPRLTRALFVDRFGFEPPPWDKTRPIKRWADTSVRNAEPSDIYVVTYFQTKPGMLPEKKQLAITNAEAFDINLPGATSYPKLTLPPSGAVSFIVDPNGDSGGRTVLPTDTLISKEDAATLLAEMKADIGEVGEISENESAGPFSIIYEPWEKRRLLNVSIAGNSNNIGKLYAARHAAGVGAPGHWEMAGTSPRWVSEIPTDTGEFDPRPEVPIPCRTLYPNEKFVGTFLGVGIQRTDRAGSVAEDNEKKIADNVAETLKRVTQLQRDVESLKRG
jgi:hypothetical protein